MKNLFLTILAFVMLGCSSEEDTATGDQLPPITTVGANTAGCLVNGIVLLPKKGNSTLGAALSCFYQFVDGGYHFALGFTDKETNVRRSALISLNPEQLSDGNLYILGEQTTDGTNYNSNFGEFWTSISFTENRYITTSIHKGELKIIKLDTQQKIISGTFWYDAVNSNGEKIEIRDGRFDMRYVN